MKFEALPNQEIKNVVQYFLEWHYLMTWDKELAMKLLKTEVIILLAPGLTFAARKQELFIMWSPFFKPQNELRDPWSRVKKNPFERMSEIYSIHFLNL